MDIRFLELLNATLGMSILLLAFVLIRDFRNLLINRDNKLRIPIILIGAGIMLFSLTEFIKYAIKEGEETVFGEVLETIYLLLTFGAFFYLLKVKDLRTGIVKKN